MTLELNPTQSRIAHRTDQHVLVAAAAGTGKTRTVVARVLYLLGLQVGGKVNPRPVPLRDIAAITYTNAAAADLVRKLRDALCEAGRRDLAWEVDTARIGTIHRFCGEVLRAFALRVGRAPTPEILEEGESRALLLGSVRDTLLQALERQDIEGLDAIVATRGADKVEGDVVKLLDRSDVLRRLAADSGSLGLAERSLVSLAHRALATHETRLVDQGAVDFDRMLTWTRDLLRDDPGALAGLRRGLHTLIVDEFQDVDPVQQEIAYLVADPRSRRPDTPRLLLVGDPKQSIYRFRFADVSGWRRVEEDFRAGAGVVEPLLQNYRSADTVLRFVEAVLRPALDAPIEGDRLAPYEVPFSTVAMGDPERQSGGPDVEVLELTGPEDLDKDQVRRHEAEWVARRAREFHDAGIPWGHMAVLLTAWAPAEYFRDALRRQGAPVWIARDEGLLERREVVDCIVALEAIRDPEDDRALFGFLRSPFVGVTDETLFEIADAHGPPYWPRLRRDGAWPDARTRDGIALLDRLVALRDRVTADELLTELLDATGYLTHLLLLGDDKRQAVANVRKFVRMARGLRRAGLGDFLRGVDEMRERKDRIPEAVLYGEHEDVVTIASIHAAKGIEWDVVFWCDVGRQGPTSYGDILVSSNSLALKDEPGWEEAAAREAREQLAERKRLWYVAATRAKRHLVISALAGDPGKLKDDQAAKWIRTAPFDALRHVVPLTDLPLPAAAAEPPPLRTLEELPGPQPEVPVAWGRPRHSATELLGFARCERRHWYKYVLGLREPAVSRADDEFVSAVARGQIVHDVLQQIEEEEHLDVLLEDAIGRWDPDAPLPETAAGARYRSHLREEVRLVAGHPDYRAIADRAGATRELPFMHVRPDGEAFEGAIDLAAPDSGRLILLDVKTAQATAAEAQGIARRYAPQRDVYVSVAEAISGLEASRFAFQFSRAAIQVSQAMTPDLRATMHRELDERLARMGRAAPRLTDHPRECFFCGFRRVGWCPGAA